MTKKLYVLWRVESDFTLAELPGDTKYDSNHDLLRLCIELEASRTPHANEEDRKRQVRNELKTALDFDDPDFIGYEMPVAFIADPKDVEFLSTWVRVLGLCN